MGYTMYGDAWGSENEKTKNLTIEWMNVLQQYGLKRVLDERQGRFLIEEMGKQDREGKFASTSSETESMKWETPNRPPWVQPRFVKMCSDTGERLQFEYF